MMVLKPILIPTLLIASITSSFGQSIVHQNILWLRYFNKLSFNDKVSLQTEFEERMYINPYREHQRLIPSISFNYNPKHDVSFNLGFTYFQQYLPHDATISPSLYNEFRPHQSITITNNFSFFSLKTRLQLEERVIEQSNESFAFNMRERLLLQVDIPIIEKENSTRLIAIVFNELMIQQGAGLRYNFFDQNRIGAGFKSAINQAFQVEAVFLKWHQQRSTLVDYFSRNIMRITLIHTIHL